MPPKKDKSGKGKRPAKSASKAAVKKVSSGNPVASNPTDAETNSDKAAEKLVSQMRDKLKQSMADPEMRDQIVQAIRTMLNEGRS